MKLSQRVLDELKNGDRNMRIRNLIALANNRGGQSVDGWIRDNKDNGPLTNAASLQVLREELGLSDGEILEQDTTIFPAKGFSIR